MTNVDHWFQQIVEGIEDNNRVNGASWADWRGKPDLAVELYVTEDPNYDNDLTEDELCSLVDRIAERIEEETRQ